MNPKNTFGWFVLAAGLFAVIFFLDHFLRPPAAGSHNVLPGLQPAAVTSVQVIPAGALEIRADRVDHTWLLAKPVAYPAQSAAVELLLTTLQKLAPATRITAAELQANHSASADFGFDTPQFSLVIEAGDQRWQLIVGNKTPPGDQVFLRVVGIDGAFVADADWLKFIPRNTYNWRSTALVAADVNSCDTIVLTNSSKTIELRRDATNRLWRMIRPLAARADSERITEALQQLSAANITQIVTDDAKADPAAFGLQPADLSLWFGRGTNLLSALQTGKPTTNYAAQVYTKREGWNVITAAPKEPINLWHGSVNDFRDPHLIPFTDSIAEIVVRGKESFTLRLQGSNDWRIVGEKFPADTDNVQLFLKTLAGMRVEEFVKAAVTTPDLAAYGLTAPQREIILRTNAGDTNNAIAQLAFSVQTNGVFAHRADEDFIYAVTLNDLNSLPESGWEFRDRHIWNFSEADVAQITLRQSGQTRTLIHNGPNKWSLGSGSEGIINPPALEETAHRLGQLTVTGWVGRNVTEPAKFGLAPANLEITVELKSGEKLSVNFGTEISNQTALAAVTLDGERWAFVFPATLYQFVLAYLTIPANAR